MRQHKSLGENMSVKSTFKNAICSLLLLLISFSSFAGIKDYYDQDMTKWSIHPVEYNYLRVKRVRVISAWLFHGAVAGPLSALSAFATMFSNAGIDGAKSLTHWWVEIQTERSDVWFVAEHARAGIRLIQTRNKEESDRCGKPAGRENSECNLTVKFEFYPKQLFMNEVHGWVREQRKPDSYSLVENNCQDFAQHFNFHFDDPVYTEYAPSRPLKRGFIELKPETLKFVRDLLVDAKTGLKEPIVQVQSGGIAHSLQRELSEEVPNFMFKQYYGGDPKLFYLIRDPYRRVGDFVISDQGPEKMNNQLAETFCESLDARLPTREELEALKRAMSPTQNYNRNAIEGMSSESLMSAVDGDRVYYFDGRDGTIKFFSPGFDSWKQVRCVVSWQKDDSETVDRIRVFQFQDDARLARAPEFQQLGPMFEAAGLIWSGISNEKLTQEEAEMFCRNLDGGGSRLPTVDEQTNLARALGNGAPVIGGLYPYGIIETKYNLDLLPLMGNKDIRLWSSSSHNSCAGFALNVLNGYATVWGKNNKLPFWCVRETR
jgi:hypothetical protein